MLFYLKMLHYSLVKRIFINRSKYLKIKANRLTFLCSFLLSLFVLVLLTSRQTLWNTIMSRVTLAPIAGLIVAIISIPFLLFSNRHLTSKKFGILRRVVKQTRNVKHIFSVLYVCSFLMLFILMIAIGISARPH